MRNIITFLFVLGIISCSSENSYPKGKIMDVIKVSQDLLLAVKLGEDFALHVKDLVEADYQHLVHSLDTDEKKIAFWLNIYNAYTQIHLLDDPSVYENRNKFYGKKFISIAGMELSLDLIEHGILRRSKFKYSLGYFNKIFVKRSEKDLRVENLDYRIHFALNCGAKSCPPIAFYDPENLDRQLRLATRVYLKGEVEYNSEKDEVALPKIFSWFRGDFGGKKGMWKILKSHSLIPQDATPKIRYKEYDWTLELKNFSSS